MWWRFCAILVLLLVVQQLHARQGVYDGPVVCTGTKPLIIHENYSNILATDADKKEYYEQYWYQIYNHLHGCEIIAGNLIIPHQHDVPFETKRLNEAIEKIEIVTGFIYIYDVGLDLDFRNLKMVYGNELFKYPSTWERDANSGEDYNVAFNKEYAIFVERFTADHLLMPQLRYIKRGNIGFKNVDKLCVWHPELQLLDFDEMFDDSFKQRVIKLDDKSFTNCDGISRDCVAAGRPKIGNIPAQICTKCFKNEEGYCQPSTKQFCPNDCLKKPNLSPTFCEVITPINLFCCPQHSHGGCSLVGEESSAFHCEKGYYLQIDTANLAAPRKCLDFCNGKVINGTDICLTRDGVSNADEEIECPDYMFTFDGGRKCSHHCPYGSEMDPIGNVVGDIDGIKDQARRDDLYKKYWPYHRKCKPCRMIYKTEDKDFVDDCGVHCVIQSNSLSFVTILNVYPAATDMKYYDLQTFTAIFTTGDHKNITDASSEIFKKQCRHIFGSLHIDQYSVGYPSNAKRLIAEHFRILTYATGLYGTIRIENTEGYWFAEPFRNLLAIDKPIPGKIALDQYIDNSVTVRYNSDLRTVDLQLLHYVQGEILVQYNPLYIPPRKLNAEKVFDHVKTIRNSPVVETVSENGLATTRTGKKITYDPGCKDNEVSFYYKRCVRCGAQEYRTFETKLPKPGDVEELFAECMAKSECNTEDGFYVLQRNGEDQCLKCDQECKKCTDQTSFSCYEGTDKNTLVCKHKKLVARNIQLCIGDGPCQAGFLTDGTNCVRCDKACVTCNDGKKDDNGLMFYSIPKPSAPKQGCRGCGFVFLAKQKNGNYVAVCGFSVGTHPRCASGETCHYFTNNILRDLWRKMKPKGVTTTKKDSFADYAVVCTGTKPLIIHENYSNILATDADKKEYYEQYWYQIYNHLHGCEIIAGNLIIPHQHDVPFETKRLNEAIEKIEIVTGFIYIYDVGLDLDFRNLKMVYGNELFKYPSTWERDANSGEDYNVAFNKEYAIFVERFTADHLLMPQLRYIKRGNIGFKNVDKLCVWHPELQLLDFDEMFDDSFKQRVIKLDDKSFTNCDGISRDCVAAGRPKIGNIPAQICTKCFKNEEGYCQPSTKQFCPNDCLKKPNLSPTFCEVITPINLFCCPQHSHGGCSLVGEESSAFHCEKGYYLQIDTANLAAPRKCLDFCNGKVINGTDICLTRDGVSNADEEIECPDYMFTFDGGRKCSHHCPYGSEMDPIGNVVGDIDGIKDQARRDDLYKKYWPYHRKCKPCRMIYKTEDKDFVDDCGVHCVIQSNSLSFVTILNVYPAATDMKYYDLQTFTAIFTTGDHKNITDASSEIFKKQCRHIFGSLHIDQYSVGYPSNAKRLIAEHFRILTYATGLYGTIRIENTEGYWFAEPFRNLLAIDKPIPGKIALDQYIDNSVTVRYNSDLRTVDLQLLHYVQGEILVQYNPLYIPPRKLNAEKVFDHVKTIRNSPVVETVSENGLATTRTGKKITYDPGCKDNEVSFYYKRCVRCGAQEYRTFETKLPKPGDVEELFAECMAKSECNTEDGFYVLQRNGEDQCLKCDQECKKCTDQTSFSCYEGTDKNTLVCKHKKLVARNIQLCIGDGPCQAGFLTDGTNCVRCDKACVTCNDGKKDDNGLMFYSIPKPSAPKQGCRGCGFVFLAKQKNGNYVAVCGFSVGTHPRCASGETCHYFTNNILRDLWRKMKPKGVTTTKKDSFADYGES